MSMLVKIRMKTLMAGPKGVRNVGEIIEVPKIEADALCPVYAELLEPATIELQKPDPKPEPDQPEDEFPKHVGGGYYILPDGSKVHGKQAALDALAELNEGD